MISLTNYQVNPVQSTSRSIRGMSQSTLQPAEPFSIGCRRLRVGPQCQTQRHWSCGWMVGRDALPSHMAHQKSWVLFESTLMEQRSTWMNIHGIKVNFVYCRDFILQWQMCFSWNLLPELASHIPIPPQILGLVVIIEQVHVVNMSSALLNMYNQQGIYKSFLYSLLNIFWFGLVWDV